MSSDIQTGNIIFRITPTGWHPYLKLARADRPIGTWLLLLPCWWSLVLASGGIGQASGRTLYYAILFALGAVLMRGAGCVVNDMWDRKLDAAVARTRDRPLASGALTPRQALLFLISLLAASFLILIQFNAFTILLGVLSLGLVVAYPAMKRITWWPQAFLGLTFNWGALMGAAALKGTLTLPALLLYAGGICWTLAYDTIYAHQDKEDDALMGMKSTALLFGEKSPLYVALFMATALLFFALAKATAPIWHLLFLIPAIAHAVWQVRTWRMDDPGNCLRRFRANRDFGLLVLIFLAI